MKLPLKITIKHVNSSFETIQEHHNSDMSLTIDETDAGILHQINLFVSKTSNDILITTENTIDLSTITELWNILYLSERHAAVSPRGANIGLLSIPFTGLDNDPEASIKIYQKIKKGLPPYCIVPHLSSVCILIKNSLIKKFGLFDERFTNIEDAVIDWCLRVGQLGYSSIGVNNIYLPNIFYQTSKFNFKKKYPFFDTLIKKYIGNERIIFERFAPAMNTCNEKPKILLSLYQLAPAYNGTAEHALSMIDHLIKLYSHKYTFYIFVDEINTHFFKLNSRYKNIIYIDNISEIYNIGITFIQITDLKLLTTLNKHCISIITTVLDIITHRSISISPYTDIVTLKNSIRFSDKIITISDTVKTDIMVAFPEFKHEIEKKIIPIIITRSDNYSDEKRKHKEVKTKFNKFILIFGNSCHHKALQYIYPILSKINYNFIIVGYNSRKVSKNIESFPSGKLSYSLTSKLYENCDALLFPSEYEGYGLPVVNALTQGKTVIVNNTEINRELFQYFKQYQKQFIFFNTFDDIKTIIEKTNFNNDCKIIPLLRSYEDIASETEQLISMHLQADIDIQILSERDKYIPLYCKNHYSATQKIKRYIKKNYPRIVLLLRRIKYMFS